MQGTASKTRERVNEAVPQKSSKQRLPATLFSSRGARECQQALGEVQPGDCPIIPGYLLSLPPGAAVFLPLLLIGILPLLVEELF